MSYSRFCAALSWPLLLSLLLAFTACSGMGAGSDPKETEGAFLFSLPHAINLSAIEDISVDDTLSSADGDVALGEDDAGTAEGEELVISDESVAPPADKEVPKPKPAAQEATDEPAVAVVPLSEEASPDEAAALSEEPDGENAPLEEGIAVLRYYLSMVSALGFTLDEEIEPFDEPVSLAVQAGQWKIVAVAEDLDGKPFARCELNGVSLSVGEEKPVALEWEAL